MPLAFTQDFLVINLVVVILEYVSCAIGIILLFDFLLGLQELVLGNLQFR